MAKYLWLLLVAAAVIIIVGIVNYLYRWKEREKDDETFSSPVDPTLSPGYCGPISTSDARVFGPLTWKTFHIMAANYPKNPNQKTIGSCDNFIRAIPYMLPCEHCGYHFREFIRLNDDNDQRVASQCMGTPNESRCQSVRRACSSRDNLVSFFTRAHNNVSIHTNSKRKRFSIQDTQDLYTTRNICVHNSPWGQEELSRDAS